MRLSELVHVEKKRPYTLIHTPKYSNVWNEPRNEGFVHTFLLLLLSIWLVAHRLIFITCFSLLLLFSFSIGTNACLSSVLDFFREFFLCRQLSFQLSHSQCVLSMYMFIRFNQIELIYLRWVRAWARARACAHTNCLSHERT